VEWVGGATRRIHRINRYWNAEKMAVEGYNTRRIDTSWASYFKRGDTVRKALEMRPKFGYCPLCGYMFMDRGTTEAVEDCPMCGEEAMPCWECISTGVFEDSWCNRCESRAVCRAKFKR